MVMARNNVDITHKGRNLQDKQRGRLYGALLGLVQIWFNQLLSSQVLGARVEKFENSP